MKNDSQNESQNGAKWSREGINTSDLGFECPWKHRAFLGWSSGVAATVTPSPAADPPGRRRHIIKEYCTKTMQTGVD